MLKKEYPFGAIFSSTGGDALTGIVLRVGAHQAIGAGEEFVNKTDIGCRVRGLFF